MCYKVVLCALTVCMTNVIAVPKSTQRIVGGSPVSIAQYPSIVALLNSNDLSIYWQKCGGSILNIRSILTAASCIDGDLTNKWRVRVGSVYANSGGVVHNVASFNIHPDYDSWTQDSDVAIVQTATYITYINNAVQAALVAGPNYIPADEEQVWAAGWGLTEVGGSSSEQLRAVQIWTINQVTCRSRYINLGWPVTDNMLCAGYFQNGGRGQCEGDTGSPLYHNSVVVGIYSWGYQCGLPEYPGVNTRISSFSVWIQENA